MIEPVSYTYIEYWLDYVPHYNDGVDKNNDNTVAIFFKLNLPRIFITNLSIMENTYRYLVFVYRF